jgi:3,5-epimerase/4-reductase
MCLHHSYVPSNIKAHTVVCLQHNKQDLCAARGIHCTIYATGCIFEYDDDHTIGGKPFTEEDNANFDGSFYSLTKGMVEQMLRVYPHVS